MEIGELLSDILEPMVRTQKTSTEAQSTEELLHKIKEAKMSLESPQMLGRKVVVGRMDITALYPSLDQTEEGWERKETNCQISKDIQTPTKGRNKGWRQGR